MKVRTDFVSNSSSSSFIVKDEGTVDKVFKEEHLTWSDYAARFFHREVADTFMEACDSWYDGSGSFWSSTNSEKAFSLESKVTVLSDRDFADLYKSGKRLPPYLILERDAGMIAEISKAIESARAIDREMSPVFRVNGERDEAAISKWQHVHWNRKQEAEGVVSDLVSTVTTHMVELLDVELAGWKFWYAELGDDDGTEGYGRQKSVGYPWHRVFSNH